MDLLDFGFRIEKSFGIKIDQKDVNVLANGRTKEQITAGDLHSWIVGMCSDQKVRVPHSSWSRVRLELARVVGKSPNLIHSNTLPRYLAQVCRHWQHGQAHTLHD